MARRYLQKSRESQIMERVHANMQRIVDGAVRNNPLPIGEQRIDPRTANRRLAMIPDHELFDHLSGQG